MKLRSLLFVPGDSERKFARANDCGADALILDLEDSVAPAQKAFARDHVAKLIDRSNKRDRRVFARVNALDTGLAVDDLVAVVRPGVDAVMIPKANGAADIARIGHYLDALDLPRRRRPLGDVHRLAQRRTGPRLRPRPRGFDLINIVVWSNSNAGQGSLWRSQHELLPVFRKGSAPPLNNVALGRFGRWRSNVWCYPGASSVGSDAREGLAFHPTVKPRVLLEDALLDVSNRDEIVLEPFAGSGSTLIAAEATERVCRAIEIDSLYCDAIVRRWQDMTGGDAVLEQTGETFATIEGQRLRGGEV
jgi:hypothetical protein